MNIFLFFCIVTTTIKTSECINFQDLASWLPFQKSEEFFSQEYPLPLDGKIELTNLYGDVKISTWHQPKVMLQATKKASEKTLAQTKIAIQPTTNTLTIKTEQPENGNAWVCYTLIVPHTASIYVNNTEQGNIKIRQSEGNIFANTKYGDIKLINNIGTIHAQTDYGSIMAKLIEFTKHSSLLLKAHTGSVTIYAPRSLNAQLDAKTTNGMITSELMVTLESRTTMLSPDFWKHISKEVQGVIGSGEAPITINVTKGDIAIKER